VLEKSQCSYNMHEDSHVWENGITMDSKENVGMRTGLDRFKTEINDTLSLQH
jgi:hypothetical protein